MLTYSLTKNEHTSLYECIYENIKQDILSGALSPNEKLPSKRSFAKNHDISIVTVENAYGQLMAEGYIYSLPKKGFFVSAMVQNITTSDEKVPSASTDALLTQDTKVVPIFDLVSNHTSEHHFPFSSWSKIMRQTLSEQYDKLLIKPPVNGVPALQEAIAKHLFSFRGITVDPRQIIIGAGTEYLYGLMVQLLGRSLTYGLENPCSLKIRKIYQALEISIDSLDMDHEGLILSPEKTDQLDVIHISPSHQFPTGIVTSIRRRYSLLQWANEREGRYIIEDDYDSEFRLQGKPIPSLFSIDSTDKVIYFNTFSKSLTSTIRISYMVLPLPLLERFQENLSFYSSTVSNFEQYTLASFIDKGYLERHINRVRNQYRVLRDELISALEHSALKDSISIQEENAGLHFLLNLNTSHSDKYLKEQALSQGISVAFLSDYYDTIHPNIYLQDNHIAIINYSALDLADIPNFIEKLENAWN